MREPMGKDEVQSKSSKILNGVAFIAMISFVGVVMRMLIWGH